MRPLPKQKTPPKRGRKEEDVPCAALFVGFSWALHFDFGAGLGRVNCGSTFRSVFDPDQNSSTTFIVIWNVLKGGV